MLHLGLRLYDSLSFKVQTHISWSLGLTHLDSCNLGLTGQHLALFRELAAEMCDLAPLSLDDCYCGVIKTLNMKLNRRRDNTYHAGSRSDSFSSYTVLTSDRHAGGMSISTAFSKPKALPPLYDAGSWSLQKLESACCTAG